MRVQQISALLAGGLVLSSFPVRSSVPNQSSLAEQAQASTPSHPRSDSDFAQIHRLLGQGKYDEALIALHDLETQHPAAKGLSDGTRA